MAVHSGSRYVKVPIGNVLDKKKGLIPVFGRRKTLTIPPGAEITTHRVIQGDTVDHIAYRYLGDASLWWVIMDINPELLRPWDIQIGDILVIPTLTTLRRMLNAV